MDDTLRGATRAVNENNVDSASLLLDELVQFLRVLRPVVERLAAADHLWEAPADPGRDRRDKESQAIVMAHTMDKPNLNSISKAIGVPRSTLQRWKHLTAALERKNGSVREPRRGRIGRDGDVDADDT
jgi:hypothetical protein